MLELDKFSVLPVVEVIPGGIFAKFIPPYFGGQVCFRNYRTDRPGWYNRRKDHISLREMTEDRYKIGVAC